jgi:hypothetical protein
MLVPVACPVRDGRGLADPVEVDIRSGLPCASVITHPEPCEDRALLADAELERAQAVNVVVGTDTSAGPDCTTLPGSGEHGV